MSSSCPDSKTLEKLCAGEFDAAEEMQHYAHVDHCLKCQAALDQLADTSLLQTKLSSPVRSNGSSSDELRQRLDMLKSERPAKVPQQRRVFADITPWLDDSENCLGQIEHYELLEFLGRGGMGVVFKARDTNLQRVVAIKLMSPSLLADLKAPQRFLREARAAAGINHPHVVTVHAVSETRELPYLVMEYVDGESLGQILERNDASSVEFVSSVAQQVVAGLAAAHSSGIVHRDIKPANILVQNGTQTVKLTDFGLARSLTGSQLTASGNLMGTPEFIAPEQINPTDEAVDHRADLFSLGSVLYRMCTGRVPFQGSSLMSTFEQICAADPVPVQSVNADVPDWLAQLVHCLLAKNPADRPDSADAVLHLIDQYCSTNAAGGLAASEIARAPRQSPKANASAGTPTRRWPLALALFAGCVVVTLIVAGFSRMPAREEVKVRTAMELIRNLEDDEHDDLLVTLTADGPYRIEPVFIEGRNVAIRAAPEVSPTIVIELESPESGIEVLDGVLTLEGIEIEAVCPLPDEGTGDESEDPDAEGDDDTEGEEDEQLALIFVEEGKLEARDCRFVAHDFFCVFLGESIAKFSNCDLHAHEKSCMSISGPNNRLAMRNCVATGESIVELLTGVDADIELHECTCVAELFVETSDADGQMTILAEQTVFDTSETLVAADIESPADLFDSRLVWRGTHNLLPQNLLIIDDEGDDLPAKTPLSLWQEWTSSTELGSIQGQPKYRLDRKSIMQRIHSGQARRADFQLDSRDRLGVDATPQPGADPSA